MMTEIREIYVADSIKKFDVGKLWILFVKGLKLEHNALWSTEIVCRGNEPGDGRTDFVEVFHVVNYLRGPIDQNRPLFKAFEFSIPHGLPKVFDEIVWLAEDAKVEEDFYWGRSNKILVVTQASNHQRGKIFNEIV